MQWEADLINWLQTHLSNGFTDALFKVVTFCGDEIFFMCVAMLFFWCISKRDGYKFINVYFVGCAIVEFGKMIFGRSRPFTKYGENGYVKSIGEETVSNSFPSGHSHSISNMSTQLILKYRKTKYNKVFLPLGIVMTVLIGFSRIYLGQHYLTDIIAGIALGIGVAIAFSLLFELLKNKEEWLILGVVPICVIGAIVFSLVSDNLDNIDKVLKVAGAYSAVSIGYFFEKRYVRFNVKAKLWKQTVKLAIGGGVALGIYFLLKAVSSKEDSIFVYSFLRYFLIGAWATIGAPALFKVCKLFDAPANTSVN